MIKKLSLAATVAAAALAATPAMAANPTATGKATVRLYSALTMTAEDGVMDFGVLVRDDSTVGYSVELDTAGALVGGCPTGLTCSGAKKAALFEIKGDDQTTAQITVSGAAYDAATNSVTLTGATLGNTDELTVELSNDLTPDADPMILDTYTKSLDGTTQGFAFAGTLAIPANVVNDTYEGSFTLTAEYL